LLFELHVSRRHDNAHPTDADDRFEPVALGYDRAKRRGESDFLFGHR
jgi:hypothetical protein